MSLSLVRRAGRGAMLAAAWLGCAGVAVGQDGPVRRPTLLAGARWESWHFASPLASDSLHVDRVSQLSLPLGVVVPLGERWTFDVSGAYAIGRVQLTDSAGDNGRTLELDGPTDVKMRLVGRLIGDALILTLGLNAPTGLTRLGNDEVQALRLLGAPPLRIPSPTLGSGLGATAGLVVAHQFGEWALATGATYETRATYTPIDAAVAGLSSTTELDPSDAVHLSLGADRLFGEHRLSFLTIYDVYGKDRLTLTQPGGGSAITGHYQLGPTISTMALLELGIPGMREMSIAVIDRYRTSYRGRDGLTVSGSSGNQLDVRLRAHFGEPRRLGWWIGGDARFDTGLDVDNSLATAAMSAGGGSLGLSIPLGAVDLEPAIRASIGSIDTGASSATATGLGFSISLVRR